jgi:hypothetical protein
MAYRDQNNRTGQVAMQERRRLQKLVDDGKACWWRRWKTIGEIESDPL